MNTSKLEVINLILALLHINQWWKNGQRFGVEANEKLQAISDPETYKTTQLPETLSFFSTDKANVVISTVKRQKMTKVWL